MQKDWLFVYGTLLQSTESMMHQLLTQHAQFVSKAHYRGRLYMVQDYPGVVPSDHPSDKVAGELYALCNPSMILPILDQYEECGPAFPEPTEYIRKRQPITLANGKTAKAWIYLYQWPTENLTRIPSGKFPT